MMESVAIRVLAMSRLPPREKLRETEGHGQGHLEIQNAPIRFTRPRPTRSLNQVNPGPRSRRSWPAIKTNPGLQSRGPMPFDQA